MLNKLQFNNLVISNKKGIQQARTQTINKLVHKIRKLKTLLEKHPENTKCKERIRKSREAMELLKKLKRIDIMKQVLLMDKVPAAIITNGLATPEEVGVALLAMNKVMQGLLKRFKTELKLDDKDSDKWKEALNESSKRRQKIERTEHKRQKRIEMKEQKVMGRNRQEWLEKNQEADGEQAKLNPEADVSTVGNWKIEELETDENTTTISKKNEMKKEVSNLKRPLKDKTTIKKKEIPNKKQKKEVILRKPTIEKEHQSSDEEETGLKMVSPDESMIENGTSEDEGEEFIRTHDSNLKDDIQVSEEDEESEETLVVDPFFITDTGENYLSTAVIKRGQNTDSANDEHQHDLHMIKLNSNKQSNDYKDRRQQSRDKNQQNFRDRNNQTKDRYQQNKWNNEGNRNQKYNDKYQQNNRRDNDKSNNFNERNKNQKYSDNKWSKQNERNEKYQQNNRNNNKDRNQSEHEFKSQKSNNVSANKTEANLHPSWAAKQKLKPVIASFQGKKITFGEDDNNHNIKDTSTQHNSNRNPTKKSSNPDNESLHPSWAAKQKLKPTITAFQGKKITFDD